MASLQKGENVIIRLVKWLLNLTRYPYAFTYKIPMGWKTYISCPPYESALNGMNDAWKIAMADERKRLTKSYKKEKNKW